MAQPTATRRPLRHLAACALLTTCSACWVTADQVSGYDTYSYGSNDTASTSDTGSGGGGGGGSDYWDEWQILDIESGTVRGDTTGLADDFADGCSADTSGSDMVFEWTAPSEGNWRFDLDAGFDGVLRFVDRDTLAPFDLGDGTTCIDANGNNVEQATLSVTPGFTFGIVVDGYSGGEMGTFVLTIGPG